MNATGQKPLIDYVNAGMTYEDYRSLSIQLMQEGKTTGGEEFQTPGLLDYNRLNLSRMSRLDKVVELNPSLQLVLSKIPHRQHWLLITESWCGDAAQTVPLIARMAAANPQIVLRLLLRDQHLNLIDRYLQNGRSRSIPKLIVLDEQGKELFHWGPRPQVAQQLYDELKESNIAFEELATQLHGWYARDKGQSTQGELEQMIRNSLA